MACHSSPVGVTAEMGIAGETHFDANTDTDWEEKLGLLLNDAIMRKRMGENGRLFALRHYSLATQCEKLAGVIKEVILS